MIRELNNTVNKYAKAHNVDIVFGPQGVVYASEKASCTSDIISGMNKKRQLKIAGAQANTKYLVVASKTKSTNTV